MKKQFKQLSEEKPLNRVARENDNPDFKEETKRLNELQKKNPQPLINWLKDSEQLNK
jgi:hypothetical protein